MLRKFRDYILALVRQAQTRRSGVPSRNMELDYATVLSVRDNSFNCHPHAANT